MQVDGNHYPQQQTPALRLEAPQICRLRPLNLTITKNRTNLPVHLWNRRLQDPGLLPESLKRAQKSQTVQKAPLKNKIHPPQLKRSPAPQCKNLSHPRLQLAGSFHDQHRHLEGLNPSLHPERSSQGVLCVLSDKCTLKF